MKTIFKPVKFAAKNEMTNFFGLALCCLLIYHWNISHILLPKITMSFYLTIHNLYYVTCLHAQTDVLPKLKIKSASRVLII